ncbi:MAG: hypothetical protein WDZ83_14700 [Rhizobiaceae bacterium]
MPRAKTKATTPVSLRLTDEERAELVAKAGGRTLSSYIRERLLGGDARGRKVRLPVRDMQMLARILACLGQSRVTESLRELSEAARIGALPVSPETEQLIVSACGAIESMRCDLVRALGVVEQSDT